MENNLKKAGKVRRLKAWLAALRSGKFKQITGAYGRGTKVCALGVARSVMNIPEFRTGLVSYEVAHFYGLPCRFTDKVITWNDADRLSFPAIADKIEAELLTKS